MHSIRLPSNTNVPYAKGSLFDVMQPRALKYTPKAKLSTNKLL